MRSKLRLGKPAEFRPPRSKGEGCRVVARQREVGLNLKMCGELRLGKPAKPKIRSSIVGAKGARPSGRFNIRQIRNSLMPQTMRTVKRRKHRAPTPGKPRFLAEIRGQVGRQMPAFRGC
jgi:hypothetical protein